MISKSDLLITTLASCALAVGVFRWHQNTQNVDVVTIPASSTSNITRSQPTLEQPTSAPESIEIPVAETTIEASEPLISVQPEVEPAVAEYLEYTVKPGDYLAKIATQNNTNVATLQRLNDIDGTVIHVGQTLRYPNPINN